MAEVATATLPQAEVTAEDALRLAPIAHARMVGSERFVAWYQVAGFAAGVVLGTIIGRLLALAIVIGGADSATARLWDQTAGLQFAGGVLGLALGMRQAQKRHQRDFLRGIRARGTPTVMSASYRIEAGTLHLETARVRYAVQCYAILEIVPERDHWLIQVDLTTFILPKRAFGDEAAQRDFLAELLEAMTAAAQERSQEARTFVAARDNSR